MIIKSKFINKEYHKIIHKTGATILLYPMENCSTTFAMFGTKYGSIDNCFKANDDKDFITVPDGIAHFLEHKMFENPDGTDAFELFAKTGAGANAFTSFDRTCYMFSTTDNHEQTIKYLLDFVQAPYFTKESVDKEQGIIGQEIKMYDDNPSWRVFFNFIQNLFHSHPVRTDIAGTVESIAEIDSELLYDCYNRFYNLNNMMFSLAGNFDVDRVLEILDEKLIDKPKVEIERKFPEEPDHIFRKECEEEFEMSIPMFKFGYKEKNVPLEQVLIEQVKLDIILSVICGRTSSLYQEMYEMGIINGSFHSEVMATESYFAIMFGGDSNEPRKVMQMVTDEIEKFKKTGIDKVDFERNKKAIYGALVSRFDNADSMCYALTNSFIEGTGLFDIFDILAEITIDDINEALKTSFDKEKLAISIAKPVSTKE